MASSAAPAPAHDLEFDHEVDDDFDPVFPSGFDPDQDIEFIHLDQPLEEPVAPIDPLFDDPTDFDMDFVDPEPVMAPEPVVAPDPALEHDPVHDDAPAVAPFVDDILIADHPVVAPPLVDDHVVDDPVDAPLLIEDPVVAPFPDPMPVLFDHAPFATHIDPRYADTRNGWIDDDDDYPPFVLPVTPPAAPVLAPVLAPVSAPISAPTDIPLIPPHTTDAHCTYLPVTFLQDIPPPRPGEGSSRQPPVPAPPMLSSPFPFTPQFPTVTTSTAPSFTPSNIMPSSSDTGVSDTLDPMAIVSDDRVSSEREVYTSDTTSTDDADFQPFALPDVGAEPADGLPVGDLPLAVILAPVPLAAYPVVDMPLDVVSDDDVDLFEEDPPETDLEGGAPIAADVILPIADAPAEEGVQHHSHDADPDMASSAAPAPAHDLEFDHEVDDDFDRVFPPGFDPDQDIEFIHLDQPLEEPVAPIDPLFDDPTDFDMDFVDPEPVMAPEPVVAPDPALEHDRVHDDAPAPAVAPFVERVSLDFLPAKIYL
ncbi:serine/threonine-protein kinase WNK2-like [Helianthus annuus]|uniref:serine/threonine-protein kinase WNK2-like n=1 Tax=Helianthus annuus TaxID=4232 RepID=UPI001653093C|nr:serine/threonine-protein kinase WNK2-like [Helianthus annuus]